MSDSATSEITKILAQRLPTHEMILMKAPAILLREGRISPCPEHPIMEKMKKTNETFSPRGVKNNLRPNPTPILLINTDISQIFEI